MASTNVVFPWSTCAIMAILRVLREPLSTDIRKLYGLTRSLPGAENIRSRYARTMSTMMWNGVHMQTIQVVIDEKLLKAADRVAQRTKRNRSELIREALREHLQGLEIRALEDRDRQGYSAQKSTRQESVDWE